MSKSNMVTGEVLNFVNKIAPFALKMPQILRYVILVSIKPTLTGQF